MAYPKEKRERKQDRIFLSATLARLDLTFSLFLFLQASIVSFRISFLSLLASTSTIEFSSSCESLVNFFYSFFSNSLHILRHTPFYNTKGKLSDSLFCRTTHGTTCPCQLATALLTEARPHHWPPTLERGHEPFP